MQPPALGRTRIAALLAISIAVLLGLGVSRMAWVAGDKTAGEWTVYGGDAGGGNFSPLTQITPENVGELKVAWRFETGEGGLQTSPLMISGVFYAMTPKQEVIALAADTGRLIWKRALPDTGMQPVRGLSYWRSGSDERLFIGAGAYLFALDRKTGAFIVEFGDGGRVDLREGLGRPAGELPLAVTTPGAIYRDLVIVGFRTSETAPAAPGAVRAYDVRSGKMRWIFHLLPQPGQVGSETWPEEALGTAGGANNWAGMVVDAVRGIVFVPTGSAVDDFYGADRKGRNLYANSLVALDAATGRRLWHFQMVHHDLWDRDLSSPPLLLTVRQGGREIDAVAQATKQGYLFLFDRETGKPLFPIEERPVAASSVPGEEAWPTQPVPTAPRPFARQAVSSKMLTNRTPAAHRAAKRQFAELRSGGQFTPLSVGQQTLVMPGFDGGAEWGGQALDPRRGVIYLNANDIAWTGGLSPFRPAERGERGLTLYQRHCAACHGMDREGQPGAFPSLIGITRRKLDADIYSIIARGSGRMPGFSGLGWTDLQALVKFLDTAPDTDKREMHATRASGGGSYVFTGYRKFLDPDGYPAVAPPWGTLSAIDLNSGEYLWQVPLGEYPELAAQGMSRTGSENYGGPVLTASGLLFIGATIYDRKFRAFDARTGEVLWQADLPFAGVATPIVYKAKGREFVVIATSGQRDPAGPQGSAYVSFALPVEATKAALLTDG